MEAAADITDTASLDTTTTEQIVRVVAPHFVAGLIIKNGYCTEAAPILRWAVGKASDELRQYFKSRQWRASIIRWNLTI